MDNSSPEITGLADHGGHQHCGIAAGNRAGRRQSLPPDLDSLTLYYDGQCRLCLAEIHMLGARNQRGLLSFVDINDKDFAENGHPVTCAAAMARMHGRLGNGQLLTGVPVFAEAYRRADLHFLAWLFSRVWTRPILDVGYGWFARYRHSISRVVGPTLLRLAVQWSPGDFTSADAATSRLPPAVSKSPR